MDKTELQMSTEKERHWDKRHQLQTLTVPILVAASTAPKLSGSQGHHGSLPATGGRVGAEQHRRSDYHSKPGHNEFAPKQALKVIAPDTALSKPKNHI